MIRVEKFKLLLQERIADYADKYKETGSQLIFGALQEARDTLEYVEKIFPDTGDFIIHGETFDVTGRVRETKPGELERTAKLAICIEMPNGDICHEEVKVTEGEARIIEGFRQALIRYKDRLIDVKTTDEDGHRYMSGTVRIVRMGELI